MCAISMTPCIEGISQLGKAYIEGLQYGPGVAGVRLPHRLLVDSRLTRPKFCNGVGSHQCLFKRRGEATSTIYADVRSTFDDIR